MIWQFIFAYCITSPRFLAKYHGIDHNVNPREDVAKYGPPAIASGKLTQKQVDRLGRSASAHANNVENFPLLVGALLLAQTAGLPPTTINRAAVVYAIARMAYSVLYVTTDTHPLTPLRSLCWWMGNIVCLRLVWLGGNAINASVQDVGR